MKKNSTRIAVCLLMIALFLCSCSSKLNSADYDTPVSCHTEAQAAYLADNYRNFKLYASGTEELSKPLPIVLGANGVVAQGISAEEQLKEAFPGSYTVKVSSKQDFSDAAVLSVNNECAEIYNLMLGTTYYCEISDGEKTSEVFTFTTEEQAPRNLFVEGVTNVRDLGGWTTSDGGKVKQGMLIRSSKFNRDESDELMITAAGIDTMVSELKVKTEIDLRTVDDNENGGITVSPLGSGVNYISLPFQSGGNILLLNKDSLADLFAILGKEENYPIVFHCSIGTDRTGAVAFLVNGLLGVEKDELYRDFLFSNFGEIGSMRTPSIIQTYYDTVDMAAGSTLAEKIYNYLVGCGADAQDLDNLKTIMTVY